MPRLVVERMLPDGLALQAHADGAAVAPKAIGRNQEDGVSCVLSCVSPDSNRTRCVCGAPQPEAIRRTAAGNALAIDRVGEMRLLDPYLDF